MRALLRLALQMIVSQMIVLPSSSSPSLYSVTQASDFQLAPDVTVADHPVEKLAVMRDQNVELLFAL